MQNACSIRTGPGYPLRGASALGKEEEIPLVKDWPETRRVVELLARERGFTVEAAAEEIERRGFFKGEALAVLKGETESSAVYLPLLADILGLSREEVYSVVDAAMTDVAVSYRYPPPPKHGRPI
jgi:hypothetical protein